MDQPGVYDNDAYEAIDFTSAATCRTYAVTYGAWIGGLFKQRRIKWFE